MIQLLRKALELQLPIDISFSIDEEGQPTKCMLFYTAFLVTEIDEAKGTFSGFTGEQRENDIREEVLTTDSIGLICDIYAPGLLDVPNT